MTLKKLSIIIPVFNEQNTLLQILNKIKSVELVNDIDKELIIIDDASKDLSSKIVTSYIYENPEVPIKYKKLSINSGKGFCIHEGIKMITGEAVIIQDADLEYNPEDYNLLLKEMLDQKAFVVYGSRFKSGIKLHTLGYMHILGNVILTKLCNYISGIELTDMETCYKLISTDLIRSLKLHQRRFGFEPELTCKIAKINHLKIHEVAISYNGRSYEDGKKIGWIDGVKAIYCILYYGLFQSR